MKKPAFFGVCNELQIINVYKSYQKYLLKYLSKVQEKNMSCESALKSDSHLPKKKIFASMEGL